MSYSYKKMPPMEEIKSLRARIEVLSWDAVSSDIATWYCYQEIDKMEARIEELQEIICDALIGSTRVATRRA